MPPLRPRGIKVPDGRYVCQLSEQRLRGRLDKQLAGTADYLAGFLAGEPGCKRPGPWNCPPCRGALPMWLKGDIKQAFMVEARPSRRADEGDTAMVSLTA